MEAGFAGIEKSRALHAIPLRAQRLHALLILTTTQPFGMLARLFQQQAVEEPRCDPIAVLAEEGGVRFRG